MLPFMYDPAVGPHGALLGHVARNNDHWRHAPVGEALVILRGPDAYITPEVVRVEGASTAASSRPGTT